MLAQQNCKVLYLVLKLCLFAHGLEVLDFERVLLGRQIFDQSLKSQGDRVGCLFAEFVVFYVVGE